MEKRNTTDSTTELSGEELIHAIVTEVEQLQSEQFDNTTATFDSLLPNNGRCNIVYLEKLLAEFESELPMLESGAGLDIRLPRVDSNFVEENCDEISPTRNDFGFGIQENSSAPGAELVAIKTKLQQQKDILLEFQNNNSAFNSQVKQLQDTIVDLQHNNSELKSQVKQQPKMMLELRQQLNTLTESHRLNVKPFLDYGKQLQDAQMEQEPTAELQICEYDTVMMNERSPLSVSGRVEQRRGIKSMQSHIEECNERIINVSSVRTGKVDGKRFKFELHSTEAPPENPQSSRAGSETHSSAECKKQFNSKSKLTRHVMIHTGEKPFQCEFCNASFSQRGNLNIHQRVHSGEKPFKCAICNTSFSRADTLRNHQLIHSDDRPFMCDICKKSFRRKFTLSEHMNIHSGRKAHKCNVCEKEFRQKSTWTKHFELHLKKKPSQLETKLKL